jgi:hypothetical protein
MAKPPAPSNATDEEVRAILERYRCPVPFHEVRTRFLGNIATPVMSASPIKTVEGLWGGGRPLVLCARANDGARAIADDDAAAGRSATGSSPNRRH